MQLKSIAEYYAILLTPIKLIPQGFKRDYNGISIEWIEGHYLEVIVEVNHLTLRLIFSVAT